LIFDSWPSTDICETEGSCIILCEIAGMKEADFRISIEGNDLRIGGERPMPQLPETVVHHRYEIKFGRFDRSCRVPNVDSGSERAEYQNGYLRIIVPLGGKGSLESVPWRPTDFYSDIRRISERLDSLFITFGVDSNWPQTNIYETDRHQIILCEIAGMKEEDFIIEVNDNRLIISGIRPEPQPCGGLTYHCLEIPRGSFQREFPILPDVDDERIEATYQDGFLRVILPKITSR
jgi:HSP20 family molecular chaperone IbpA